MLIYTLLSSKSRESCPTILGSVYNVHIVHIALYNVQCTMYNVQCTMYSVQCTYSPWWDLCLRLGNGAKGSEGFSNPDTTQNSVRGCPLRDLLL